MCELPVMHTIVAYLLQYEQYYNLLERRRQLEGLVATAIFALELPCHGEHCFWSSQCVVPRFCAVNNSQRGLLRVNVRACSGLYESVFWSH